jgi:hypothetical protein
VVGCVCHKTPCFRRHGHSDVPSLHPQLIQRAVDWLGDCDFVIADLTQEGAVEEIIGFIEVGSAIGLSILLALGLEWLSLRALMFLMPGRAKEVEPARSSPLVVMTARPKQVSRWASFSYPKDAAGRQVSLDVGRAIPVARKLRGEVARELLTASGRVRLNRVVLP